MDLKKKVLPPRAGSLIESLRDLGYSLETAVADIIDNSISAGAGQIDIWCSSDVIPLTLAIVDNGEGMDEETLVEAMRPGSTNPNAQREGHDLGRFGLGLKTASFSQGRSLSVISRRDGHQSAAEWDLDRIEDEDDWVLALPEATEISEIPWLEMLGETGTMVVWQKLDRLAEDTSNKDLSELINRKLAILSRHLSLVFHRFMEGDAGRNGKLKIRINGLALSSFDPFCRSETATQVLPVETMSVDGEKITITPYILPHHSKLSPTTWRFYRDRSDFLSNQGAYVYRNGRLMAWGDWFRMIPKGEATKLARVQIDFPSTLDHQWTIDIKKSRAKPPPPVRDRFKRILERIAGRSVRVHRGRGERALSRENHPLWTRQIHRERVLFLPNEDHPLIATLLSNADNDQRRRLLTLLQSLGASFPIEALYAEYADNPVAIGNDGSGLDEDERRKRLRELRDALDPAGVMDVTSFVEIAASTSIVGRDVEALQTLAGQLYETKGTESQ